MKHRSLRLGILSSCLVVFAICTFLAVSRLLQPWERQFLHSVYDLPTWLYWPFYILTITGSVWIIGSIALVLIIRKNQLLAKKICINAIVVAGFVEIIKNIVMRPRPYLLLGDIPLRAFLVRGYGFPSGHTAVAAAIATTLWLRVTPRYRPLLILWVALVGLSRMYLGVHAPLDVIGGASIGCALTLVAQFVFYATKLKYPKLGRKSLPNKRKKHKLYVEV